MSPTATVFDLVDDPVELDQLMAPFALSTTVDIIFSGIPLPPSSNNMYTNARFGGRQKSAKLRMWERDFACWALENAQLFARARQMLKARLRPGVVLSMHSTFFFDRKRILCKDGKPKKNDTSNYLKALHDAMAATLQIDDAWFFDGMMRKRPIDGSDGGEMCVVEFEFTEAPWALAIDSQ